MVFFGYSAGGKLERPAIPSTWYTSQPVVAKALGWGGGHVANLVWLVLIYSTYSTITP